MMKGTMILAGMVCVALAVQSAHGLAIAAPVSAGHAMGGLVLGGECSCVLDQDGDGLIRIQDVFNVVICANGDVPAPPLTCDDADLNCDGVVDYCDVSRVVCAFQGNPNCCEAEIVCGACCHSGLNFDPCIVISEEFCHSLLIGEGVYLGDGTACDPWPCGVAECKTHDECDDENFCTADACTEGTCVHEALPNGIACADVLFCNGDETCQQGVCVSGPPRSCNDGLTCTVDTCNEEEDACVHAPIECNNDGVCNSPCENADNCAADCNECSCVLDQDGDGLIKIQDVVNVVLCVKGEIPDPPLTCDDADLNCDGEVDYCDVSRVVCAFQGNPNCCEAEIVCGACCNSGANFGPCLVISEEFCHSLLISEGDYLGDGTVCDPWPCESTPCSTDEDCQDGNACTTDTCTFGGLCENTPVPNGTPCPDELFCNGDETCQLGACQSGPPRSCDDLNPCTIDACDEIENACRHTPTECNHDGVCDSPCENADNCLDDCSTCTAMRDLADGSMAYCPEVLKTVHITLNVPSGALTGGVEDAPPTGWNQISNISDGGTYDSENHKVKWGPFFAPFPGKLSYDVLPPTEAVGVVCFAGAASFDGGAGEPICGDECIEDSCCPDLPADAVQPVCEGCSDDCSAPDGDGRIELCEMIRYACAWKRGCNDDLTGVTGSAFLWMVGECYCWDGSGESWVPESCGQSTSGCCEGGERGRAGNAAAATGTATAIFDSIGRGDVDKARALKIPKVRGLKISILIDPPAGTSAAALDLRIPKGWVVSGASDGGNWDRLHRKVKWGPFFGDQPRTVTVKVDGVRRRVHQHGLTGTVSFDGKDYPITIE